MKVLGRHFLLELEDCNAKVLDDIKKIEEILVSAARAAKATVIETHFHKFNPFGISGVVVIAESHLTIHTWPEHSYAAVDIFTCSKALQAKAASEVLIKSLNSKNPSMLEIRRGLSLSGGQSNHQETIREEGTSRHVFGKMPQMVR